MHILLELHMWENRYRQFKDQSWNCTCGKRGLNQKVELHMWENVSPLYFVFVFVFRGICCVLTTYHLYYPSFLQCYIIQGGMTRFNTVDS